MDAQGTDTRAYPAHRRTGRQARHQALEIDVVVQAEEAAAAVAHRACLIVEEPPVTVHLEVGVAVVGADEAAAVRQVRLSVEAPETVVVTARNFGPHARRRADDRGGDEQRTEHRTGPQ
ncbi:hypothetical protein ETD83_38975 [Actinomadura soli]|uniref:Uncharacterized protein n=1 Tax=Actinomadura soli TaxID=2508997 RepID=A0A5C4J0C5_9ACTN|nr:hypothetical protein ETD83_38975 [Actinomadura soli]